MAQAPQKRSRLAQNGKSQACRYQSTPELKIPGLNDLFTQLSAGETPDFLQMLTAISEMVAFYTECDIEPEDQESWLIEMSQNKCRFCS